MKLVGILAFGDSKIYYYSEDNRTFFIDAQSRIPMSEEYLRELTLWFNSPLNHESKHYKINNTKKNEWYCVYTVESLGNVQTTIYGDGASEIDALICCHTLVTTLQKDYNAENAAITESN